MREDHDIFHTPNNVTLTIEDRPISSSYPTRYSGRDLGETMPMWRVQTEGYLDGKGMLVGVVSHAGLEDSPDGEYISGGMNSKGYDSVAIGRQGNFLHWGFAASPTYMTEEAKLVFINAVHYISRFDGHKAFVHKASGVQRRASVDDMLYAISDEGFAAWTAMIDESNAQRAKQVEEYKQRKARGEELTRMEEQMISMPPSPPWDRKRSVNYIVPQNLQAEFGENWDAYHEYYSTNRPYLHPEPGEARVKPLVVDKYAKSLGIANDDIALLEHCISAFEADAGDEQAAAALARYTNQTFKTAAQWRNWLDSNRDRLFFTEVGGYKFMVDVNAAGAGASSHADLVADAAANLKTEAPSPGRPVQVAATIVPANAQAGDIATFIIKKRILAGWHTYASLPPGQPYVQTSFQFEAPDGIEVIGEWDKPAGHFYPQIPGALVHEGEVVYSQQVRIGDLKPGTYELTATVNYQTCDIRMCLPPASEQYTATITIN